MKLITYKNRGFRTFQELLSHKYNTITKVYRPTVCMLITWTITKFSQRTRTIRKICYVRGGSRISEWVGAQAPREVGFGEGVSPSPMGEGDTPIFWRPIFLNFRPGMLHFEANFRQLTRPVAISLKPARSCVVASQPVKSLECHRQTKDRKVEVDLSCCRLKISLTTNHNISDD